MVPGVHGTCVPIKLYDPPVCGPGTAIGIVRLARL